MLMKRLVCALIVSALILSMVPGLANEASLNGYDKKNKTYDYVLFGNFPTQADGTESGILWRVLSAADDSAYLLSDLILEARRIDPQPYPYSGWQKSELYKYLNGEFEKKAFSDAEQTALILNEDEGAVTLPTIDDVRNADYGLGTNDSRQAQSTEYAKANGLFVYQGKKQYSPYWTRTPSTDHAYAHRKVMDDGKTGYHCVETVNIGMRPAITIDLSQVMIVSGSGSKDDPYQLSVSGSAPDSPAESVPENDKQESEPENDGNAENTQPVQEDAASDEPKTDAATSDGDQTAQNTQNDAGISQTSDTSSAAQAYNEHFTGLTAEGFMPQGAEEFIYEDSENGLWLYASENIRIEIQRKTDTSKKSRPQRWLEADIFVRSGADDFMKVYYNDKENPKKEVEVIRMAKSNHLVFAINSDWYYYRVKRNTPKRTMAVGVILREGKILYDDPAKKSGSSVPNRDILALYPDASLKAMDYNAMNAQQLADDGAYDVLSFGPVLLNDGEVTAQTKDISSRQSDNPRMGIGLVEPGHYVAIMMEGRISESKGCTLIEFAQLFQKKNCVSAYNLDGGGTATMMFMGEYINKLGSYTADKRLQIEVLGIGQSDKVQP